MVEQTDLVARYQKIIEISRDLVSTLNLDEQLEKIVHAAANLCDAEAASLLLYDAAKQSLFFQAASNLEEPLRMGIAVPMDSLAGWVVNNRQPVLIGDKEHEGVGKDVRHFGEVISGFTTHSLIGVPIMVQRRSFGAVEEKIIGVIEVINKKTGSFDEQDLELIVALGAQAAVAIENTHLFQQSDLISEFVHELRAPLAALSNAAYLLQRTEVSQGEENYEGMRDVALELKSRALQTIQGEAEYITELADGFLSLARLESGRAQFQPRVFDVPSLLEECLTLVKSKASEKQLKLEVVVPGKLPSLKADRSKIKQVLINLLSNAIKYTPEGGDVELAAEAVGKQLVISVKDSGRGIPPKLLERVFDKFYRVPGSEKIAPGTGLGLAICKMIVESHRGTITISSQIQRGENKLTEETSGTRVLINLPVKPMG